MSMMARRKAQKALANSNHNINSLVRNIKCKFMASHFITGECPTGYTFMIGNGQGLTQYKWDIPLQQIPKEFITSSSISYIEHLANIEYLADIKDLTKILYYCCFGITFKDVESSDFNKDYTFNVHLKILQCYEGKAILFFGESFFDDITADEKKIAKGDIIWENIIHQCGLDQVINQRVRKIFIFDAIIFHHLSASFNEFQHPWLANLNLNDVVDITRTFIFMNQTNKKIIEKDEITKLFEKVYTCFSTMSSVRQ